MIANLNLQETEMKKQREKMTENQTQEIYLQIGDRVMEETCRSAMEETCRSAMVEIRRFKDFELENRKSAVEKPIE